MKNYIYNFNFQEPLEQFEIVKIGYEWWSDNTLILSIINFFSFNKNTIQPSVISKNIETFNNIMLAECDKNDPMGILDQVSITQPDPVIIKYLNNLSYDFFDSYLVTPVFWGIDFNSTIFYFILLIAIVIFIFIPNTNNLLLIPTNWQLVLEGLYNFVTEMLEAQIGKEAQRFFPYVYSIFIFILTSNMLGMTLFSFTLTSHIMVTFTLGVSSFIGLTILGFVIQKLSFLNLFLPKGIPTALIPMLVVIEVISYFLRALSLSVRLFANLMSGHILLHILAFFSSKLFKFKFIVGLISFILILAIVALEFCIAILQAYVFAILICIYLNDSFHASH